MKWIPIWAGIGIIGSAIAGYLALPLIGTTDALTFGLLLSYAFFVSMACSLILVYIINRWRGSIWVAFAPAIFCFAPMGLAWFPISSWMFNLGFTYGHGNTPDFLWLGAAMFGGFFVPGGLPLSRRPKKRKD